MAAASLDWFSLVKEGGAYCAPLLLGAVFWLNADRARLLQELKAERSKVDALAERVITLATEVRNFLFNERKAP